ncbi:hypothetical protein BJ322DRAFT_1031313 [Thelephora terrestris]|uniref:Uncharacterized protein n=1 Tax=Thelephora terrestris TaxID=56493 RepID=A0A9P6HQV2_9AGAM|nr:hypothetical protein BJ322DRAFT_1031313 [Thelephora terrestris]
MSSATTTVLRAATRLRLFHSTACTKYLVGPPDPISNIRPAIYHQEDPSSSTSYGDKVQHPYSLKEFIQAENSEDYQVNLQKTQLDAFDRAFWTNNNYRFEAAKAAALDALPEKATAQDREFVLSNFYRDWLIQESPRLEAYNETWRRRSLNIILLDARTQLAKFLSKIGLR